MGLIDAIGQGPVALDTAVFIYWIEAHDRFAPLIEPVFSAIAGGSLEAATSVLTLMEVLVVPYRAGNRPLAERYEALLTRSRGLSLVPLSTAALRAAAQIRAAAPRVRTPDALQMAAALAAGCPVLVTNDRQMPPLPGLRVLQLRDFATP